MTKVKMLSAAACMLAFGATAQAEQAKWPDLSAIDSFTNPELTITVPAWSGPVKFTKVTGCASAAASFKLNDMRPLVLKAIGSPLVFTVLFPNGLYLVVGGTPTLYGGARITYGLPPVVSITPSFLNAYSYTTLPATISTATTTFTFTAHITRFANISGCTVDVKGTMKKI